MITHTDWTSRGFSLAPVANAVGPFAGPDFLATLWNNTQAEGEQLVIAESTDALTVLTIVNDTLGFVGHRDLVDYRSPLGPGSGDLIGEVVRSLPSGTRIVLDSLPSEAAHPLAAGLRRAGIGVAPTVHDVAAVLALPPTFDEYLTSIGKKDRHELRRKRRRFEMEEGPFSLQRAIADGTIFKRFVEFHRRSEGEKGRFMTPGMEQLFSALLELPGWGVDALLTGTGEVAAAAFGYADEDGYYLYNSAFDPALRQVAPGQVLLGAMIEQAIGSGHRIFDFLKGNEAYKFRLGAVERPLLEIAVVT
ncbi:MAG: GNAT family N-acetyltransferase [Acidimicrobiia bacterium]|nr:GNAT family N-acetyltransferase [Acidimicrobiia bacterium]